MSMGNVQSDTGAEHVVVSGECISSIAEAHGLFWETVWNDSANAELKRQRGNPNVLHAGDRLLIPARRPKEESGSTESKHRFKRKGVPARLLLKIMANGKPRAGERYVLYIDGVPFEGKLDDEGKIDVKIPPTAQKGSLYVGDDNEAYALTLGHLDPVTEMTGVQARLQSLGYECGPVNGQNSPETQAALKKFQWDEGLETTGEVDQATQDALVKKYGS